MLEKKIQELREIIGSLESVIIAFSGGVDSSVVSAICRDVLGENAVAITATSPTYPPEELEVAKKVTAELGIKHIVIETNEFDDPNFNANPADRCYYCKLKLCKKLRDMADELGIKNIVDGTNADDFNDYRPGIRAAKEHGVLSPLAMAKITKSEVRAIAEKLGLSVAHKAANPCLASRIPFGTPITIERLQRIARAEKFIRERGFEQVRVRDHGDIARIEVGARERPKLFDVALLDTINRELTSLGYRFVTLDAAGYRQGSLNPEESK
jgi:uncharacterized protein